MKTYIYLFIVIIFTGCIHNKNEFKVSDLKFETEDLDTTLCKKYSLGATNKYDLLQKRFSNNIFLTKDKCYVNYFNLSFLKKGHFKKIKFLNEDEKLVVTNRSFYHFSPKGEIIYQGIFTKIKDLFFVKNYYLIEQKKSIHIINPQKKVNRKLELKNYKFYTICKRKNLLFLVKNNDKILVINYAKNEEKEVNLKIKDLESISYINDEQFLMAYQDGLVFINDKYEIIKKVGRNKQKIVGLSNYRTKLGSNAWCVYKNGRIEVFNIEKGLYSDFGLKTTSNIRKIILDKEKNVWIGLDELGKVHLWNFLGTKILTLECKYKVYDKGFSYKKFIRFNQSKSNWKSS